MSNQKPTSRTDEADAGKALLYMTAHGLGENADGRLGLPTKTISALAEYAKRWPGPVIASSSLPPKAVPTSDSSFTWAEEALAAGVQLVDRVPDELHALKLGVGLVQIQTTAPGIAEVARWSIPVLITDDNAPDIRKDITLLATRGAIARSRVRLGHWRQQSRINRLVKRSSGFQCNGYAAAAYYSQIRKDTMRFFDHRVKRSDIQSSFDFPPQPRQELRLAFSGRLIEIKGVRLFPQILSHLDKQGLKYRFDVFGDGPLQDYLIDNLGQRAQFHGFVRFDPEWKDLVRGKVDLMLLPHLQGDSSSTYFEALGMGVPVLGFENETLTPLARESGAAWTVSMANTESFANKIVMLSNNKQILAQARRKALEFMLQHSFESEMDTRLAHMRHIVLHPRQD